MGQVRIRMIEEKDIPFVQEYVSKEKIADTTNVPHPYPKYGARLWYKIVKAKREKGNLYPFAILYDEEFAGSISVRKEDEGTGAIDYWVAPNFWNKGIGTKAVHKAIDFGIEELKFKKFETCCLVDNPSSGRVLEKNGFKFVKEFQIKNNNKHEGKIANLYRLEI
ncbi:GNAT family N-acetyltransferase [Lederbergia lenta]|uniref:Acetyltransferase, gnat family n=1 Tax=Lederbergia lenta TaxID=1467 RepID=A0A2X4WB42_LEDLE|nr:GNAT family N-acetyltransferase [Lederbergia lenta]MCM3109828.1 GNAT family N-acetyltransferase [Lederbergia lenta]MEC2324422.1 GNAT family N-acetyltransferase [Lederbergia lenta]SQI59939.1 acetyltransferase, gnat family [Lederbergia lenta]